MLMEQFPAVSHLIFDIFETPQQKSTKARSLIFTFFLSKKGSVSGNSRTIEHSSSVSMTAIV